MVHWRRRIAIVSAVLAIELAASVATLPAHGAEPTSEGTASFADALRVRTTFGLRADSEYVSESLSNLTRFSEDPLAVPMTVEEAAEIWRRLDVQHRIDPVAAWAAANLDGYAGMYINQASAGQPVFLVTAGTDESGLYAKLPPGIDVDIVEVTYSLKELLDLQAQISKSRETLVRDGIPLVETAIDTAGNAVVLGLDESTASSMDRSVMLERFGSAVRVETTTPGTDDTCFGSDCMPTRSAIGMRSTEKGNACTIGWPVKIYQHPWLSTPRLGLITSGHCFRIDGDPGYGVQWRHELNDSSSVVGYAYEETFTEDAAADVGLMTAHNTPTTKNLMVWRTTGETKQIIGFVEDADQHQGDAICRIGVTSQRDCGQITLVNKERWTTVSGYIRHLQHQNVYGIDSLPGDSGGPVFSYVGGTYGPSVLAYGIHIHSKDPPYYESWFSTWEWSSTQLSQEWSVIVGLCHDADC